MSILRSSNPILAEGRLEEALRSSPNSQATVTVAGVVNKTTLCLAVAVVFGALGNSVVKPCLAAQAGPYFWRQFMRQCKGSSWARLELCWTTF